MYMCNTECHIFMYKAEQWTCMSYELWLWWWFPWRESAWWARSGWRPLRSQRGSLANTHKFMSNTYQVLLKLPEEFVEWTVVDLALTQALELIDSNPRYQSSVFWRIKYGGPSYNIQTDIFVERAYRTVPLSLIKNASHLNPTVRLKINMFLR